MKRMHPPPVATWLLTRLAGRNDALTGDLLEEFRKGRSAAWYWKQTLMAIAVSRARGALLTLAALAAYAIGTRITIPGANASALEAFSGRTAGSFRLYNIVGGGNLASVTVFALGIGPYVSAAILVQAVALFGLNLRWFDRVRLPIRLRTWCVALLLSAAQATGIALFLERLSRTPGGLALVYNPGWSFRIETILLLTTGTACLMWISDQITERGIGDGMLLVSVALLTSGLARTLATPNASADFSGVVPRLAGTIAIVALVAHGYRHAIERERVE